MQGYFPYLPERRRACELDFLVIMIAMENAGIPYYSDVEVIKINLPEKQTIYAYITYSSF